MRLLTCAALAVVLCAASTRAQEKDDVIGWADFPPRGFPCPDRLPRSTKEKDRVDKKLAKDRTPIIAKFVGREFFGLCEIVSVEPSKKAKGKIEIVVGARKSLEDDDEGWDRSSSSRAVRRLASWHVDPDEAKHLAAGEVMNVKGEILDVSIQDWQNDFADSPDLDIVTTIYLHKVE